MRQVIIGSDGEVRAGHIAVGNNKDGTFASLWNGNQARVARAKPAASDGVQLNSMRVNKGLVQRVRMDLILLNRRQPDTGIP